MNVETHTWLSSNLGQEMTLRVYGQAGKPVIVFPALGGTFHEFEDFGMVEAVSGFVEAGQVKLFTVATIDRESWANWAAAPANRARPMKITTATSSAKWRPLPGGTGRAPG